MAEEWVRAVDLLSDSEQRKWLEHAYIEYFPDDGKMSFPYEETGQKEYDIMRYNGHFLKLTDKNELVGALPPKAREAKLIAKTEHNRGGCHLTLSADKKLMVVTREVTEYKVFLYGYRGFDIALELFQEYAKRCFGNSKLKAEPVCLNEALVNGLSEWLKKTPEGGPYWLADREKQKHNRYDSYSPITDWLFFMSKTGEVRKVQMYSTGHNREKNINMTELPVRFAAFLPPETVVNIGSRIWDGSTPIRPLQIKLGKPSDDSKLKMPKMKLKDVDIDEYIKGLCKCRQEEQERIAEIDSFIARLEKLRNG